jgi:hypothetical protein
MWDCHSCDPGSNPGPGAVSSLRIPISTEFKNNTEYIISKKDTTSIVRKNKNSSDKIKLPHY